VEQEISTVEEDSAYYLAMKRVPKKTYHQFKELAENEFCKDYGMCLKHLIDLYFGVLPHGDEHLLEKLNEIELRLDEIEARFQKPPPPLPVKTSINGQPLGVRSHGKE
jgi:hypothetical protein